MEYARVTEIIREVLGLDNGLVNWIRYKERCGIDTKKILEDSAKRGTRIHDYVSKVIQGKKTRIQKQYKSRVEILLDFLKDKKNIQTEVALKSDKPIQYQGHLDYLYEEKDGWVISDLKTGRERKEHELQLFGYASLFTENYKDRKLKRLELLYLKPSYMDFVEVRNNPELWNSLLKLYEWKSS